MSSTKHIFQAIYPGNFLHDRAVIEKADGVDTITQSHSRRIITHKVRACATDG